MLYNQRHGKQRGGRKGQRMGGHPRHVGRRTEPLIEASAEHSPQVHPTAVQFHGALEDENLLASFTQAYDNFQYGAGDYGSSVVALVDGFDEYTVEKTTSSLSITAGQDDGFQLKNRLQIDAMALAKLFSTLPTSTRINLSDDMGKYLVTVMEQGCGDDNRKSLAAHKLESLREANERAYEEEQRASRQASSNDPSNTDYLEIQYEGSSSTDNPHNVNLANSKAIADEAKVQLENEEEDLDAWLESVIS